MNVAAERIYSTWIEDRSRKQHGCAGRLWGWGGGGHAVWGGEKCLGFLACLLGKDTVCFIISLLGSNKITSI